MIKCGHATAYEKINKVVLQGEDLETLMLDWNAAVQITQGNPLSPRYVWGKLEGLLKPCQALKTEMEHYKREETRGGPDYCYNYLISICQAYVDANIRTRSQNKISDGDPSRGGRACPGTTPLDPGFGARKQWNNKLSDKKGHQNQQPRGWQGLSSAEKTRRRGQSDRDRSASANRQPIIAPDTGAGFPAGKAKGKYGKSKGKGKGKGGKYGKGGKLGKGKGKGKDGKPKGKSKGDRTGGHSPHPNAGKARSDELWQACQKAGVCMGFQLGTCPHMSEPGKCKYPHQRVGGSGAAAKAKPRGKGRSPSPARKNAAKKGAAQNGGKTPDCVDFQKGYCQYGSRCPFNHHSARGSGLPAVAAPAVGGDSLEEGWDESGWDESGWDEDWGGYYDEQGNFYYWGTGDSWLEYDYWNGHGDAVEYDEGYGVDPLAISTEGTPNP